MRPIASVASLPRPREASLRPEPELASLPVAGLDISWKRTSDVGLTKASDEAIWEFAGREGFVLVTLDSDFADIAALRGAPPKVIWLRCGNQATAFVEDLLREHAAVIEEFEAADGDAICLELY